MDDFCRGGPQTKLFSRSHRIGRNLTWTGFLRGDALTLGTCPGLADATESLCLGQKRFGPFRSLAFQQLLEYEIAHLATVGAWNTLARRSDVPSSSWTRDVSCIAS